VKSRSFLSSERKEFQRITPAIRANSVSKCRVLAKAVMFHWRLQWPQPHAITEVLCNKWDCAQRLRAVTHSAVSLASHGRGEWNGGCGCRSRFTPKLTRPRPIRASKRRDAKSHSRWQPLEDGRVTVSHAAGQGRGQVQVFLRNHLTGDGALIKLLTVVA
jgi:hypothetical protein